MGFEVAALFLPLGERRIESLMGIKVTNFSAANTFIFHYFVQPALELLCLLLPTSGEKGVHSVTLFKFTELYLTSIS